MTKKQATEIDEVIAALRGAAIHARKQQLGTSVQIDKLAAVTKYLKNKGENRLARALASEPK